MATLWPLSAAASTLAAVGYVPEFKRLWQERRRGSSGVCIWLIWTLSAAMSLTNTIVCEASPLVIANIAIIFAFSAIAALLNLALPPVTHNNVGCSSGQGG